MASVTRNVSFILRILGLMAAALVVMILMTWAVLPDPSIQVYSFAVFGFNVVLIISGKSLPRSLLLGCYIVDLLIAFSLVLLIMSGLNLFIQLYLGVMVSMIAFTLGGVMLSEPSERANYN